MDNDNWILEVYVETEDSGEPVMVIGPMHKSRALAPFVPGCGTTKSGLNYWTRARPLENASGKLSSLRQFVEDALDGEVG